MNDAKLLGAFRVCAVVFSLLTLAWLLFGCYRPIWAPDSLRPGEARIIEATSGRLVVTEGYVHRIYREMIRECGKGAARARLLSLLVRENADGTWVIRRER